MPIREIEMWNCEVLRLTVFPLVGQQIDPESLFQEVSGMEAVDIQINRETGRTVLSTVLEEGRIRIQFSVQPDRQHWVLLPIAERSRDDPYPPVLGPYPELLETLHPIAERWLSGEHIPEINRIAFGGVLTSRVDSQAAGYEMLSRFVPSLEIDSENVSDIMYHINRHRILQDSMPDLSVNRLTKWSVSMSQFTEIQVSPDTVKQVTGSQKFSLRLELDMSTDQSNDSEFPGEVRYQIYRELTDLGTEIASEGDIP